MPTRPSNKASGLRSSHARVTLLLAAVSCSKTVNHEASPGEAELRAAALHGPLGRQPADPPSRGEHCGPECCPSGFAQILGTEEDEDITGPADGYVCIVGDLGDDTLHAPGKGAYIAAGPGDDTVVGGVGRDTLIGDDGHDVLRGGGSADHLDGGYGDDTLYGEDGNDLLLGGPGRDRLEGGVGSDALDGGPGEDELFGGPGDDYLWGGLGDDQLAGGDGNDVLFGGGGDDFLEGGNGDDYMQGGAGNDVLRGGPGNDRLMGGPGVDEIYGGEGDDTIVIHHACELESGDLIDGGPGHDVLISPYGETELRSLGVRIRSIEAIRISEPHTADVCRMHSPNAELLEVSGRVVAESGVWHDPSSETWYDPDGALHEDAQVWTRWTVRIDAVYEGPAALEAGAEVQVLTMGGQITDAADASISMDACCGPEPLLGGRYRLGLRGRRDATGALVAYELENYQAGRASHGMFLPLPPAGPIPMSLDRPGLESPGALCPLPEGKFGTYASAIGWANIDGRWNQNEEFCPGNPQLNDCKVAIVTVSVDPGMNVPDDGCATVENYAHSAYNGLKLWHSSGNVSYRWGVFVPGVLLNSYAKCEAHKKDGKNCVALDVPNEDVGGAASQPKLPDALLGLTKRWSSGVSGPGGVKLIDEADMVFRKSAEYSDVCSENSDPYHLSLFAVGAHEFGHVLGFLHPKCLGTVMSDPQRDGGLTAFDEMRARVIYPAYVDGVVFPNSVHVAP